MNTQPTQIPSQPRQQEGNSNHSNPSNPSRSRQPHTPGTHDSHTPHASHAKHRTPSKPTTFADMFERWTNHRRAAGRKDLLPNSHAMRFYRYVMSTEAQTLDQHTLDAWLKKGPNESDASWKVRFKSVLPLLKFLTIERRWLDLFIPSPVFQDDHLQTVRIVTKQNLDNLFKASLELQGRSIRQRLTRIEFPVLILLMESAGLRPNEARELRTKDVNLKDGIISITETKGYIQHHVVLHDTMLQLLKRYDAKVATIVPARKTFFPTPEDTPQDVRWLSRHFEKAWTKYNAGKATSYVLRHHYATTNVLALNGLDKAEGLQRLKVLSASMGHRNLRSTLDYLGFTADMAQDAKHPIQDKTKDILPELPNQTNEAGQPDQTGQVDQPAQPDEPAEPDLLTQPVLPEQPDLPDLPTPDNKEGGAELFRYHKRKTNTNTNSNPNANTPLQTP